MVDKGVLVGTGLDGAEPSVPHPDSHLTNYFIFQALKNLNDLMASLQVKIELLKENTENSRIYYIWTNSCNR